MWLDHWEYLSKTNFTQESVFEDLNMSSAKSRQFCLGLSVLTDWRWVTHIRVSKLTTIGSGKGLPPNRRQAIIWTNAGIVLILTLGRNFSEILNEIHTFPFKKMYLKRRLRNGGHFVTVSVCLRSDIVITNGKQSDS